MNEDRIRIFADVIQEKLGVRCSALSGANVANEGVPNLPYGRMILTHKANNVYLSNAIPMQSPMASSAKRQ